MKMSNNSNIQNVPSTFIFLCVYRRKLESSDFEHRMFGSEYILSNSHIYVARRKKLNFYYHSYRKSSQKFERKTIFNFAAMYMAMKFQLQADDETVLAKMPVFALNNNCFAPVSIEI